MPGTNISRYELMTVYITSDCNEIQAHPRNLIVSADRSWCIVSKVYKVKLSVNTITYKKNLPIYMICIPIVIITKNVLIRII